MYINNLRYGEISRRNAGRFDTEFYQNGAFLFRNMITNIEGGATRRPPIRKLIDTDAKRLIPFTISETLSYVIGLSNDKMHFYRYVLDEFSEVVSVEYPQKRTLTDSEIRELTYSQYYTRLYFAHQNWRPIMMDFDTASESATVSEVTILLNQDAKNKYWFTPSYITDEDGKELTALEARILYQKTEDGTVKWYLDQDFSEPYEYATAFPPVKGGSSYITGFEDYKDDDLLTGDMHYPAVVAVISDCLWFACTKANPHTIWKSRVLGSSQFIDGFEADSMHDFIQFQIVTTETTEIVDSEELPKTELKTSIGDTVWEQESAEDMWFLPEKNADGEYTYKTRVYWKAGSVNGEDWIWYLNPDDPEGSVYDWQTNGYPVRKPVMIYDFSNISQLTRTKVAIDYVATDSCSTRNELATGRQDRIGTSTAEWRLPDNFSAVNNQIASPYTNYGSISVQPVILNGSMIFIQKSYILREFYLYEGYMANGDVTITNHDILKDGVKEALPKNTPTPTIYFVMDDGAMRVLVYDKENNIQSFARWDMENRKIVSESTIETANRDIMLFLVNSDTESFIAYLDETETETFSDEGGIDYISELLTPYLEIIDQKLGFGRFKKANQAYIRPYDTGYVYIGDDDRQLNKTNYPLGNNDYRAVIMGKTDRMYSMRIRSFEDEPMTILAFQIEGAA